MASIRPPPESPTNIQLIFFDAGGGHRASATALQQVMRELQPSWQATLVNLFELLDPQQRFERYTGMRPETYYNQRLAKGWTAGLAQELKLLQGAIRLGHSMLLRPLQQHWLHTEPDLVVSLVPNFNRAMYESLAATLPGVPFVTVLTDLADHPPHFWIEPGQAQHFVCGTPRAVQQARTIAGAGARVHATSGMILRPDFYRAPMADRGVQRRAFGLDAQSPTGLVMFGGQGSKAMIGIAEQLADTPLILVCGHNHALAQRLRAQPATAPRVVLEFIGDMPRVMQLADFFIGKPGPGSLSEAVQMGLPPIVVRNAWTMPQERYNTEWIVEGSLGLVLPSFKSIRAAVMQLTQRLGAFRANVARHHNRAVFEVPGILASILDAAHMEEGTATSSTFDRERRAPRRKGVTAPS